MDSSPSSNVVRRKQLRYQICLDLGAAGMTPEPYASRMPLSIIRRVWSSSFRARAEINSHFAAGPQARWRGASDELYPGRYVRSEQQSQRACGPQPEGARRRAGICFVAAPRRCPTSTSSRRLASARPALAPKCEVISARALGLQRGLNSKTGVEVKLSLQRKG